MNPQLPIEPTVQDAWWNKIAQYTKPVRDIPQRFDYWMRKEHPNMRQLAKEFDENILSVPDPSDAFDPIAIAKGVSAVVPPAIKLMRKLKFAEHGPILPKTPSWITDKLKDAFLNRYSINMYEGVPFKRRQREKLDIPAGIADRGAIFVSPYREYHNYSYGGGEGGNHLVEGIYNPTNPLSIHRVEKAGFIGKRALMKLLGQETGYRDYTDPDGAAWSTSAELLKPENFQPNKEVRDILGWIQDISQGYSKSKRETAIKALSRYAPKNKILKVLDNPHKDFESRLTELVASERSQRGGYDSIWSLWPNDKKSKEKAIEELKYKLLDKREEFGLPEGPTSKSPIPYENILRAYMRKYPHKFNRHTTPEVKGEGGLVLPHITILTPNENTTINNLYYRYLGHQDTLNDTPILGHPNIERLARRLAEFKLKDYPESPLRFTPTQAAIVEPTFLKNVKQRMIEGGFLKPGSKISEAEKQWQKIIGPSGGYSGDAIQLAIEKGMDPIELGNILKKDFQDSPENLWKIDNWINKAVKDMKAQADLWKPDLGTITTPAKSISEAYDQVLNTEPATNLFKDDFHALLNLGYNKEELKDYFVKAGYMPDDIDSIIKSYKPKAGIEGLKSQLEKVGTSKTDEEIVSMLEKGYNNYEKFPKIQDFLQDIINQGIPKDKLLKVMENSNFVNIINHLNYVK